MKKYSAIALLLAAVLTLSACGNNQNENSSETTSQPPTENTAGENTDNSADNNEANGTENGEKQPNTPSDEVLAAIEQFTYDSFTGPDGQEVMLTEATETNGFFLGFDFGYIRFADAIYSDTVANPDLFDFENYAFTVDNQAAANPSAFKVVKGQKLDNGLTVSEASYQIFPEEGMGTVMNTVELDGELTLEGLLFCYFEEEYGFTQDEVLLHPNPASADVPAVWYPDAKLKSGIDLNNNFAFICDGNFFRLGDLNEIGSADWFADGNYVRVKVTLSDLKLEGSDGLGEMCYATLKNVEFLDN